MGVTLTAHMRAIRIMSLQCIALSVTSQEVKRHSSRVIPIRLLEIREVAWYGAR